MNAQESLILENFLARLAQAGNADADPQAASIIDQAIKQRSDGAYLLVQRNLILEAALTAAREKIDMLELAHPPSRRLAARFPRSNAWRTSSSDTTHPVTAAETSDLSIQERTAATDSAGNSHPGLLPLQIGGTYVPVNANDSAFDNFLFNGIEDFLLNQEDTMAGSKPLDDLDLSDSTLTIDLFTTEDPSDDLFANDTNHEESAYRI